MKASSNATPASAATASKSGPISSFNRAAARVPQATTITNVYAILRGTDPANAGRIYLVTGHYDSRNSDANDAQGDAPGANDDASGTAVSLECARVLSKHRFPATIIFLTVAGEEQGLYGSAHFAKMSKAVGWDMEAVLNNDIVGGDRTPGDTGQNPHVVRVFSEGISSTANDDELRQIRSLGGESDGPSRQLARYIAEVAEEYFVPADFRPLLVFRHDRYLRGGDHFSFNEQGFAAVRFTEYRENFNHQHQNVRTENGIEYGDLPKFVDYDYTANVARLNAATLASLASAPAPPANVRLLTKALQNDSTLEWEPSPGGLATGYEVLVARHHRARLAAREGGRQRDSRHLAAVEGQCNLCCARGRRQRPPQSGGSAAAGALKAGAA